ncbi:hypothetical protein [Paracidobacterium acidisoli]|uniref:hypothetical protein n=1 Tax=Paracidobacterium acidisoli TaxID=2303751 RepID=UPI0011C1CE9E|nr:hypothetical protein [Paracidobacterium acidisoli]MBT9329732.1 hypothetical protein [Paracidobacterium acidisoli]
MLITEQDASAIGSGALPFVDAFYDIRHAYNATTGSFSISGYSGKLPVTIQNMPEQQTGGVYDAAAGSFTLINYAGEKVAGTVAIPGGLSSSIFISRDENYVYAANNSTHVISVVDRVTGGSYALNLPNVNGISVNPGGTIVLAFLANSDDIYSVVHLTTAQQTAAANNPHYQGAEDCEPQNLPQFCVFPVSTGTAKFDRPLKAVFSSDGSSAYVIDCGPECGGSTAGVTVIPITGSVLNQGSEGASGISLAATSFTAIPGGATNGLFSGNTLYIAGQQFQGGSPCSTTPGAPGSGVLMEGCLTVLNTPSNTIGGVYSISDGTHNKMVMGDESTLWIGAAQCQAGVRYQQVQAGVSGIQYGCLTMFNTSTNTVTVDAYKGDATGIAAVLGLNKIYSAEGGQVYIYNTSSMTELDNSNVSVTGTAVDVAYMDAATDSDNTTY